MGKIRPRRTFPRNNFVLHGLKVEYCSKWNGSVLIQKHKDFVSFFKSDKIKYLKGEVGGEHHKCVQEKVQKDFYILTCTDGNLF